MKKFIALALAVGMTFTNSILAGETLVRDSIKSENYVAGASGWTINRDGTSEFSDSTIRGELLVGDLAGKYIHITNTPQPIIKLGTGDVEETTPASVDALSTGFSSYLFMSSPERNSNGLDASISLISNDTPLTQFAAVADESYITSAFVRLGESGTDKHLQLAYNAGDGMVEIRNPDEAWNNIARVNSWVDFAGARANYFKDATGRVQLRGQVASGTAALIGTLPVGYRPTQTMEWIMRGVGGVTMCAVTVSTAGAITVTANVATAQASGIRLDSINFPTF